jgi:hypothetical protein
MYWFLLMQTGEMSSNPEAVNELLEDRRLVGYH